jgi:hypothetical protein
MLTEIPTDPLEGEDRPMSSRNTLLNVAGSLGLAFALHEELSSRSEIKLSHQPGVEDGGAEVLRKDAARKHDLAVFAGMFSAAALLADYVIGGGEDTAKNSRKQKAPTTP